MKQLVGVYAVASVAAAVGSFVWLLQNVPPFRTAMEWLWVAIVSLVAISILGFALVGVLRGLWDLFGEIGQGILNIGKDDDETPTS